MACQDLAIATVGGFAVDMALLAGVFDGSCGALVASRRFLALFSSEEAS